VLDTVSSEFELVNNTQKEVMMYIGILARMIAHRECDTLDRVFEGHDRVFLSILLDLLKRPDIDKLKTQHENTIAIKKVTGALNLKGIFELLSINSSPTQKLIPDDVSDLMADSKAMPQLSKFAGMINNRSDDCDKLNDSRAMPQLSPRNKYLPPGDCCPVD
jgi:hypothetical protein